MSPTPIPIASAPALETVSLTRMVGSVALVADISVAVRTGEVLGVAGPSGAGKTSFLRLLNRLDEPTSGHVLFEGQDTREIPPPELRRKVGMVTQTPYLFPGTVAANLRYGPEQHGAKLSEETLHFLLEEVGLADMAESDVAHLSVGEAQRVSLARALANAPSVLLLDEPTSALDEASKQSVEELILKIVRENALTCVMVSHDLAQAGRMAQRVLLLRKGRLEKIGPATEVIRVESNLP
jgi:putative ABC transport system ATP-binding protein